MGFLFQSDGFPLSQGLRFRQSFNRFEGFFHLLFWQRGVNKSSAKVGIIATQIHEAMAAPVEKDHFLLSLFLCLLCFFDDHRDGMTGLRGRNKTFGPCPENCIGIALQLVVGTGFEQFLDDQLANKGSEAVIAEPSSMDGSGNKGMSKTVHR